MRHQQYMKNELRIAGKEVEKFLKKNPTAIFWVETGWGDQRIVKSVKGWHYERNLDCFSSAALAKIPEVKVFIPKE